MPRETFSASSSHGSDRMHVEWGRGQVTLANEGASDDPGFPRRVTLRSPFNNPDGLDQFIDRLVRARLEAFGRPQARAIVVEVIEESRATDDTLPGSIVIPSDVRINGQSVLTEGGVKIDSIDVPPRALATVTMTMPVRRVTIAAEGDLTALAGPVWAHRQALPAGGGWISDGEPVCDLFGFGVVYLPFGLVRCYLATRPEVTGDAEFSRWHHEHGHGPVPIHWDVRPIHLHY